MTRRTRSEHDPGSQASPQESAPRRPKAPPGSQESLWPLAFAPMLWMLYFLMSYATAAIWCAKVAGRSGSLDGARLLIGSYTVLTLIGIGLVAWRGFRRHSFGTATVPHDFDTPADRHRFLGFATLLLGGLSAVATLYVAFAIIFIGNCL